MKDRGLTQTLDNLPLGGFHRRLLLVSGLGWMFDAMDVGLVSFVLAALVTEWKLTPTQVGWVSSAGFVGMFLGAATAGALADRFGRKLLFQSTLVIYSVATGLCALAGNLGTLLGLRFFVGLGLGGELPVASALVSEFSPARRRGLMIVILESFWAYGWTLAALIGYLVIPNYGWRIAFLIGAVPSLYVLVMRRGIPESPRYLASKGRFAEAEVIVRQVAGEAEPAASGERADRHPSPKAAAAARTGFGELWKGRYLRRTVMLWVLWFGIVFSYYGVFTWLPSLLRTQHTLVTTFEYTLIITLAQIPGYFSAAFLVERWGRKPTLVTYLLACAVGAFFFRSAPNDTVLLLWGCAISFFNLGAWGVVYTYTPELYPTRIRGTGAGFAAAFGRIGGIIGPYVVALLLPTWTAGTEGIFLMFAVVFFIISVTVAVLGEETRGGSLEKIAA
jgi:MFS transporter, putative metabolite:H+ symporter